MIISAGKLLIGNVLYAAAQWLLLAYLVNAAGLETAGHFAVAVGILTPIYLLLYLGGRTLIAIDSIGVVNIRTQLIIRASLCITALTVAGLALAVYPGGLTAMIFAVSVVKGVEGIADLTYGVAQQAGRTDRQGTSLTVRAIAGSVAFIFGANSWGLWGGFGALSLMFALITTFYDLPIVLERMKSQRADDHLPTPFKDAIPIVVGGVVAAALVYFPRYVLQAASGSLAVGGFAALTSFSFAFHILPTTIGQTLLPRLAVSARAGEWTSFYRSVATWAGVIALLVVIASVGAYLFGSRLVAAAFGVAAAADGSGLWIYALLLGPLHVAQVLSFANIAIRQFWFSVAISAVGLIAGAVATGLLAGQIGPLSGAVGLGIAGAVQCLGYAASLASVSRGRWAG